MFESLLTRNWLFINWQHPAWLSSVQPLIIGVLLAFFLGTFMKLQKVTIIFIMSVYLQGTTWLTLLRFSWNVIFEYFLEICRENSTFVKISQEQWLLYMKTILCLWLYLAQFFIEWEKFQMKVVEEIKTHILCSKHLFFSENFPFMR